MGYEDAAFTPYHKGRNSRHLEEKAFVAWDGEGITPEGQLKQNYVLFGNSDGFVIKGRRLRTHECLALIIEAELYNPQALHVGFAFSYDVEMILADLPLKALHNLRHKGNCFYAQYRIEYKRGKWFQISTKINGKSVACRIWDVWGFFQSSFVAALKDNIGEIPELKQIEDGKSGRAQFSYDDLDSGMMEDYWRLELRYTVEMMNALRTRLFDADLRITQWHGPGAIATYAMTHRRVGNLMDKEVPQPVSEAAQYAYAGGRFELFRAGHHEGKVYAYDIRSAYPSAIVNLPSLSDGEWRYNPSPDPKNLARFGVYRIAFASQSLMSAKAMPFFYRDPKHRIHFPNVCEGWYWTPEAELSSFLGKDARIVEGWEYVESGERPFAWVEEVYNTRAEWKRNGNPSQMALKLLLNSLYGKFAQRVGWEKDGKSPKWHQLEWAGFVTSTTRAKIFRAMLQAQKNNALLGVETDGIFTTEPLNLDIGSNLGQWELSEYEEMIYLQSGFYFKKVEGEWSAKYRGFDKGCISAEQTLDVLDAWKPWDDQPGLIHGTTTRFTTMGAYLRTSDPEANRNRWLHEPRILSIGAEGKRVHRPKFCPECLAGVSPARYTHTLTISNPIGGFSEKHSLPWVTAQENEFRLLSSEGIPLDH